MGKNQYNLDEKSKDIDKNNLDLTAKFEDTKEESDEEPKEEIPPVGFFKLYRYATGFDKFLLFVGVITTIGTGVLQPLNTLIFGTLTGDIVKYGNILQTTTDPDERKIARDNFIEGITNFAIYNSAIGVGMLVLTFISTQCFNYSSIRQIFKIRSLYLKKVLNQDISWYDVHQTGDFSSRMSEDLAKFEDGIGEKVSQFINFQVVFVGSLILALVKGWELALICLTSLPVSMICIGIIGFLSSKIAKKELDAYAAAGSIAEEVFSSIRTVIAFGGQKKEIERYDKNLDFAKKNNIKRQFMTALGFGLLWFVIYASYALAFWYGVKLVLEGRDEKDPTYDAATMITVFFSVMTASMNFGIASPYIEAFSVAKAAGAKIMHVIDNAPIINASKNNGAKLDNIKGNITFKNVVFHYPSRKKVPILQGLDLQIKAGDTVALVGSSGCGKSTVIQLIQRFYDPIEGEVCLDDHDLKSLDLTWLRQNIGVVGQEPVLFATTILENIKYGKPDATFEEIKQAAKKANAHEFIKALPNAYNTLVGERGAQLSGGQKQRIAIARALVRNPAILLLDEATSALDTNSEARVQAAIDSASRDCTTIIVAHRLSTIRNANKIVVMSGGKMVEEGTHAELMEKKQDYFNLVTAQVQGSIESVDSPHMERQISFDDERKASIINDSNEDIEELDDAVQGNEASFWSIIKMNQPETFIILIGCIGSIIMGASMPLFAILFGSIIGVLGDPDVDYVRSETNKYCLYLVLAGVSAGLSMFFQIYMFSVSGEKLTKRIRSQMFQTLLKQEMGYYDRKENGVGALCSRLSTEAAYIQGATGQRIGTILQAIMTLVLSISLSMYYEWRLGLVALAFTPFILVAMFLQGRYSQNNNGKREKSLQNSTKIAVEAVGNIRTVASLGCEEKFQSLYVTELINHNKSALCETYMRATLYGIARSLMFFAYAACMYYGGQLVLDGEVPYGNVYKVSQALIMGTVSIANALAFSPNLQKGLQAASKVLKLLNRVPKIRDESHAQEKSYDTGNITYSQIEFSYPTRPNIEILKGLNLSVMQGKTVALVGQSGCGKSTIIQLIERFYDPAAGNVEFNEENIKNMTLSSLRSHLGIVSQEPNLFNRTIKENIAYGRNDAEVEMDEIMEAAKNANIHNFIASLPLGYDTPLGEKGTQLSGGQKQRIAIARALIRNPKVLLLDEATSALDTESEKVVQEALDNAKKGRTCITIAHRLTTIQDADLICVINQGVVAESGTHRELLEKRALYYKLHTLQNK